MDVSAGMKALAKAVAASNAAPSTRTVWGRVTSTSPEVVELMDAPGSTLEVSANGSGVARVGDRVLVTVEDKRLTIIGNPSLLSDMATSTGTGSGGSSTEVAAALSQHKADPAPHAAYDNIPSLVTAYQAALA